jgi:hypothetical protein
MAPGSLGMVWPNRGPMLPPTACSTVSLTISRTVKASILQPVLGIAV